MGNIIIGVIIAAITVKTFLNVPLEIPEQGAFEVRGEGVISWVNFDKINASLEEPYTHPRNLAAGSVRKLDANESRKRFLEFFAFELVSDYLEPASKIGQDALVETFAWHEKCSQMCILRLSLSADDENILRLYFPVGGITVSNIELRKKIVHE